MHPPTCPTPSAVALEPSSLSGTQAGEGFLAAEKWPSMSPGQVTPPNKPLIARLDSCHQGVLRCPSLD